MAFRNSPQNPRPDNTQVSVGDEGVVEDQEQASGKAVHRRGGSEGETDVNLGTKASPQDIVANPYASGLRNTGGAEAIAGEFVSDDGNAFKVEIDWLDADGNVVKTHAPSATNSVTDVEFTWRIRSDRWELRVEDTSGAASNNVHGSANTH